jgi:hypothetical protein
MTTMKPTTLRSSPLFDDLDGRMKRTNKLRKASAITVASGLLRKASRFGNGREIEHARFARKAVELGGRGTKLRNLPATYEVRDTCMALPSHLEEWRAKTFPQFHVFNLSRPL